MDEMNEVTPLDEAAVALADYLYNRTAQSKVTGKKTMLLSPPAGTEKEMVSTLLKDVGTAGTHPALLNIDVVMGKKDEYCYDETIMTKHYAELDALLEDKDIIATIASVTRSDSKLYPRPTQFSKLMNIPFRFSMDEILGAAARMETDDRYKDIGVVTASNGKSAFFSDQHLSRRYAQALIQEIEVDGPENP